MGQSTPFSKLAMVVEDDPIQREMIAILLEESGFQVLQFEDADSATMVLKVHHAAVLITDVNLIGKMTGVELAHIARAIDPDLRIVVTSGRPCQSVLPSDVTFLSKPVYPVDLLRMATN
ncbi:two-component system cell cycle response regulator CpdR [Bradyrhizobium sp. USDA 4448]